MSLNDQLHKQRSLFPEECLLKEIANQPRLSIGIPKENASIETRLALTPEGVAIVTEEGHSVYVERGAGEPMSYSDLQYSEAGAFLVDLPQDAFSADIVIKITPPTLDEINCMNDHASIFSMLQLSNLSTESIKAMMSKKLNAIAYELIRDEQKGFPVVSSISEIEGNTAITLIAELMSNQHGEKACCWEVLPASVLLKWLFWGQASPVPLLHEQLWHLGHKSKFLTTISINCEPSNIIWDNKFLLLSFIRPYFSKLLQQLMR